MSQSSRVFRQAVLPLALALGFPLALAADTFAQRLESVRGLAGADPHRALAALESLRNEAQKSGRHELRLGVDEVDCRILTDIDGQKAMTVAEAGIRRAGMPTTVPVLLAWLKLRACHAGAAIGAGNTAAGEHELDEVLTLSRDEPMVHARALALLESGVHHSRSGAFLRGQDELLKSCELLKSHGFGHDLELCLSHLANHYKRVGDLDEALRLLSELRTNARARGAVWDDGIYALGVAQIHHSRASWPEALMAFQEAVAIYQQVDDKSGEAYAEHGLAATLLRLDKPVPALRHIDRALEILATQDDPMQVVRSTLLRARLLAVAGRAAEAVTALQDTEEKVLSLNEDLLSSDWWETNALAQRGRGHWREAYESLAKWMEIDARIQKQRKSEQAARLRVQFNRAQDIEALETLKKLSENDQRLRRTQAAAIALFVLLLVVAMVYAVRKVRESSLLRALASTDELTGLPNRRAVIAYAENLMHLIRSRGGRLSVLMIDVDRFKQVNDTHGHGVGDEVLRHIAHTLPIGLRSRDRLGRLGGEEFVVFLPDATIDHAAQIANRMREAIEFTPARTSAGEVRLTISIGVSEVTDSSDSVTSLLDRADEALYKAKADGRNAVVVATPVHASPLRSSSEPLQPPPLPVPAVAGSAVCPAPGIPSSSVDSPRNGLLTGQPMHVAQKAETSVP